MLMIRVVSPFSMYDENKLRTERQCVAILAAVFMVSMKEKVGPANTAAQSAKPSLFSQGPRRFPRPTPTHMTCILYTLR
jgi:hypothetical protein